jgi:hypothetical protein
MRRAFIRGVRQGFVAGLALLAAAVVRAEFAAAVSPPRFEFDVQAGHTQRQVLEISHAGAAPGRYRVYTADWQMTPSGDLSFSDALLPGSCRPWVALERREVTVLPGVRLRFRFEVAPPAGTAPTECRFALMVGGAEDSAGPDAARFPVSGRIGVIVYARVGGVAPQLQVEAHRVERIDGRELPAIVVRNAGQATGRLTGFLSGRDAKGRFVDLAPATVPVLPGMSRLIGLLPVPPLDKPNAPPPAIEAWPLQVEGHLETQGVAGARLPLKQSFPAP